MKQRSFAKFALTFILVFYSVFYLKKNFSSYKKYQKHLQSVELSMAGLPPERSANSILSELKSFKTTFQHPCPETLFFIPEKMNPNLTMLTQISLYSFTPCRHEILEKLPDHFSKNSKALIFTKSLLKHDELKYEKIKSSTNYTLVTF